MKLKHNQKVTCEIQGEKITDARISINKDGMPYICQNVKDGVAADDKLGYKYSWKLEKDFTESLVTNLKPLVKDWENLEVGDILVNAGGVKVKVLAVCGLLIGRSTIENHKQFNTFGTKEYLIRDGWTIEQEEEIEEMTMEELCKELGREVKIKK